MVQNITFEGSTVTGMFSSSYAMEYVMKKQLVLK